MSAWSARLSPLLLLVCALGCASVPATVSSGRKPLTEPQLTFEQLPSSDLVVEQRGAVSIAYQVTVRNPLAEPIRLTRLDMKTVGRSPYLLRAEQLSFNETIEPGKDTPVVFSMWAIRRAQRSSRNDNVWVQGTATFEGPNGTFQKTFSQAFAEPE
jgi:hypothetical protein